MKRYDCYYTNDFNSEYPAHSRAAVDGDWVSFEDAQAEVANADEALRQAVAVISSRNEQIAKLRDELTAATLERDALWNAARTACEGMGCFCAEDHDTTSPEMRSPLCRLGDLLTTTKVKS